MNSCENSIHNKHKKASGSLRKPFYAFVSEYQKKVANHKQNAKANQNHQHRAKHHLDRIPVGIPLCLEVCTGTQRISTAQRRGPHAGHIGKGSAVIVGRCSDYILRYHENALNVFITAPLEDSMKRTCERGEATPENVEHFVNKKDKGREEYYNYYSFGNWGMAAGYDICINSSVLGIEGSADLIIEFARRSGLL